ncbi:MAG: hypothetical protein R2712_14245 [Vicinamibacterales bacterium]
MRPRAAFVAGIAAAVMAAGAASIVRPGYSPDEEFTLFAVRGIAAHGLPSCLPACSTIAGSSTRTCPGSRRRPAASNCRRSARSAAAAAATLALAYRLVCRLASAPAAVAAVALAGTSVPFWAVATSGRFYAPFLLTCVALCTVLALAVRRPAPHLTAPRTLAALAALGAASRLTHELAFTLVAMPALGLAVTWMQHRDRSAPPRPGVAAWAVAGAALMAGLGAAQALLMLLHFVRPESGGSTMIQRFFLWQVLNLFERPAGAPVGLTLSALVVACLVAPQHARRAAGIAAAVMAAALGWACLADPPRSWAAALAVIDGSLRYPLDMFWYGTRPPAAALDGPGTGRRAACRARGRLAPARARPHRPGPAGCSGSVSSTPASPRTTWCCRRSASSPPSASTSWPSAAGGRRVARARAHLTRAALVGLALAVAAGPWTGPAGAPGQLAHARPTIDPPGLADVRRSLRPTDRIACTDELACLELIGRVDAWLALDDYVRDRFVVVRNGRPTGVYAGTPAVFRPADLFGPDAQGAPPARVLVVDVFKEYAVGWSTPWLPRAASDDGLELETLLVTPQVRVVQLRRPAAASAPHPGT